MKQVTLNTPDSKYSFFMELVKNLGLQKVKDQSKLKGFINKNVAAL